MIPALAFASGWTFAIAAPFASRINTALLNAFSQVGQNLFGEAVFDAVLVPPNPVTPAMVQVDVALDSQIRAALGVFVPPNPRAPTDPCRKFVQLELLGGQLIIAVAQTRRRRTSFPRYNSRVSTPLRRLVSIGASCWTA